MAASAPPSGPTGTPQLDPFSETPALFGFSVPGSVPGGTGTSVNRPAGAKPFQFPSNPFFAIPDLGSDGDFEAMGFPETSAMFGSSSGDPILYKALPDPFGGGGSDQDSTTDTGIGMMDGDMERTSFNDMNPNSIIPGDGAPNHFGLLDPNTGSGSGDPGNGDDNNSNYDSDGLSQKGKDNNGTVYDGPKYDQTVTVTAARDTDVGAPFHIDAGIYDGPNDHPGDALPADTDAGNGLFLDVFLPKSFDPSDGGTININLDPTGDVDAASNGCDDNFLHPYIPYLDSQLVTAIYSVLQDIDTWRQNPAFVNFALTLVASDLLGAEGLLKNIISTIPAVSDLIDEAIRALADFITAPATDLITSTLDQVYNNLTVALNNAEAQAVIDAISALAQQQGCVPQSCIKKYGLYQYAPCADTADNDSITIKLGDPAGQAMQLNRNFVPSSNLQIPQLPSSLQSNKGLVNPFFNVS